MTQQANGLFCHSTWVEWLLALTIYTQLDTITRPPGKLGTRTIDPIANRSRQGSMGHLRGSQVQFCYARLGFDLQVWIFFSMISSRQNHACWHFGWMDKSDAISDVLKFTSGHISAVQFYFYLHTDSDRITRYHIARLTARIKSIQFQVGSDDNANLQVLNTACITCFFFFFFFFAFAAVAMLHICGIRFASSDGASSKCQNVNFCLIH